MGEMLFKGTNLQLADSPEDLIQDITVLGTLTCEETSSSLYPPLEEKKFFNSDTVGF